MYGSALKTLAVFLFLIFLPLYGQKNNMNEKDKRREVAGGSEVAECQLNEEVGGGNFWLGMFYGEQVQAGKSISKKIRLIKHVKYRKSTATETKAGVMKQESKTGEEKFPNPLLEIATGLVFPVGEFNKIMRTGYQLGILGIMENLFCEYLSPEIGFLYLRSTAAAGVSGMMHQYACSVGIRYEKRMALYPFELMENYTGIDSYIFGRVRSGVNYIGIENRYAGVVYDVVCFFQSGIGFIFKSSSLFRFGISSGYMVNGTAGEVMQLINFSLFFSLKI